MAHIPVFVQNVDVAWMGAFHAYTSPVLDWAAWGLSTIGWFGACWFLLAAVLWIRGYRLLAAQIVLAMVIGGVFAQLCKLGLHRLRPSDLFPQYVHLPLPNLPDTKWSFPSGHAALAASAALTTLFATHKARAWWLVALAVLISWARIYQGVHWPSDVFFGFIVGIVAAVVSVIATPAYESWITSRQPTRRDAEAKTAVNAQGH